MLRGSIEREREREVLRGTADIFERKTPGLDADGKPLAVRDTRSLCAWLHNLHRARVCQTATWPRPIATPSSSNHLQYISTLDLLAL